MSNVGYLKKGISIKIKNYFLLMSCRSPEKRAGSGPVSQRYGSAPGFVLQCHGSGILVRDTDTAPARLFLFGDGNPLLFYKKIIALNSGHATRNIPFHIWLLNPNSIYNMICNSG
jgi:hypothetical protein